MADFQNIDNYKLAEELLNEHGFDIPSFLYYECHKNPSFLQNFAPFKERQMVNGYPVNG